MTALQTLPTAREHASMHVPSAACVWCAWGPPWWQEFRLRRGMNVPPYLPIPCPYCEQLPVPNSPLCPWH